MPKHITSSQWPDGKWWHVCPRCRTARVNQYPPPYHFRCRCDQQELAELARQGKLAPRTPPPPKQQRLPCVFLGEPTGRQIKAGCSGQFFDERKCLCGPRRPVVKPGRRGPLVVLPTAMAIGTCSDLQYMGGKEWGIAACQSCPFRRAGLLPAPAQENAGPGRSLEGS